MRKKYHIKGDKLIIESDPTVKIPIIKILFVKLENDAAGPCVEITTVSGAIVRFWVDSNQTGRILNLIQDKRAKALSKSLKEI